MDTLCNLHADTGGGDILLPISKNVLQIWLENKIFQKVNTLFTKTGKRI